MNPSDPHQPEQPGSPPPPPQQSAPPPPPAPADEQDSYPAHGAGDSEGRQLAMLIHLSVFAGFIIPFAGLILPVVIWQMKKDEHPHLTAHAYVVFNFILSVIIYSIACALLTLILIGFIGFLVLAVAALVFPIMGGIKANEGELWEYPGSIRFFK